ncbi:HET-domain-containing protein [Stemphylium lycopersici]|nr:hypothetical protein TW65_03319 [Stemphylium lycopersici]RAQ99260.1 HET-domain-containing protein [Stemphylium lycopersici]
MEIEKLSTPSSRPQSPDSLGFFEHKALDNCTPTIRLIRILPQSFSKDFLQCEIRDALTSDTYVCLSYVWGAENPGDWIILNGQLFWVRKNLHDFLNSARTCAELQSNVSERNHQVQQMGKIFEGATEVVAWLGLDKDIALFFEWVPGYNLNREETRNTEAESVQTQFGSFTKSDYWNRAWITQEVTLARRLSLMAGDKILAAELIPLLPLGYDFAGKMLLKRGTSQKLRESNLIHLLAMFSSKRCQIDRDRVFSLLAICSEGADLQVDYEIPHEMLAVRVLESCRTSFCLCSIYTMITCLSISPKVDTRLWNDSLKRRVFAYARLPVTRCAVEQLLWNSLADPDFRRRHVFTSSTVHLGYHQGALSTIIVTLCLPGASHRPRSVGTLVHHVNMAGPPPLKFAIPNAALEFDEDFNWCHLKFSFVDLVRLMGQFGKSDPSGVVGEDDLFACKDVTSYRSFCKDLKLAERWKSACPF